MYSSTQVQYEYVSYWNYDAESRVELGIGKCVNVNCLLG